MLRCMLEVQNQTAPPEHPKKPPDDSIDKLESQIFSFCGSSEEEDSQKKVTVEEYLCWTVSHPELPAEFSRLIYQLCHVVIGLRPTNRSEEGSIVRGWLEREERNEWVSGRSGPPTQFSSVSFFHNGPGGSQRGAKGAWAPPIFRKTKIVSFHQTHNQGFAGSWS